MAHQKHVHIITAGENIHTAYPAAIRDLKDITHTFVFADTELYTNSARDDERTKRYKEAARDAVNQVRSLSTSLKIPVSLVYIDPPSSGSVAKAVLKIHKEHPGAKYTFDLTGGSKDLGIAVFNISLWLEGDAYYAFCERKGNGTITRLAVPKIPARDVWSNQNYMKILALLTNIPGMKEPEPRILPRSYIFTQLESFYVPVRKKGVKAVHSGKADLNTGKKAVIPVLSQGTFSNIIKVMVAGDLIHEVPGPDNNRKEKYYSVTPVGGLAFELAGIKP
jgi:hypothetical protein